MVKDVFLFYLARLPFRWGACLGIASPIMPVSQTSTSFKVEWTAARIRAEMWAKRLQADRMERNSGLIWQKQRKKGRLANWLPSLAV